MRFRLPPKQTRFIIFGIVLAASLYYFRYIFHRPIGTRSSLALSFFPDHTLTEIFAAAEEGDVDRIRNYLNRGGSPNMEGGRRTYGYQTLLHWAGTPDVAELLIARGADVNARDVFTQTPLHTVTSPEVAQVLIDHGARLDVMAFGSRNGPDYFPLGYSPLHTARSKEIAEVLINHGAHTLCQEHVENGKYPDELDWCEYNLTPLHRADTAGIVDVLVEHGMDVNATAGENKTPLHSAATGEVAIALLEHGADIEARDKLGRTPLHLAKSADVAEVLLRQGADIEAKDNAGQTPIQTAATREIVYLHTGDSREIFNVFLDNGYDIRTQDDQGRTPLHLAAGITLARCESPKFVAKGYEGKTWKFWGDECIHNTDLAEFLIAHDPTMIHAKDDRGQTPLYYAALFGVEEAIELLVAEGAEVNVQDDQGHTPLFWALYSEPSEGKVVGQANQDVVELFLKNGIDVNARNNEGMTVLGYIEDYYFSGVYKNRYQAVHKLLRRHGAE